jgi:hypothetical protein
VLRSVVFWLDINISEDRPPFIFRVKVRSQEMSPLHGCLPIEVTDV